MQWRIYYDDGTTFSDQDGTAWQAPSHGVIAIVAYDEEGERMVVQKWDYYFQVDGIWYGADLIGMIDQMTRGACALKLGRTIPNAQFREIVGRAAHDPDFPRTTQSIHRSQPRALK